MSENFRSLQWIAHPLAMSLADACLNLWAGIMKRRRYASFLAHLWSGAGNGQQRAKFWTAAAECVLYVKAGGDGIMILDHLQLKKQQPAIILEGYKDRLGDKGGWAKFLYCGTQLSRRAAQSLLALQASFNILRDADVDSPCCQVRNPINARHRHWRIFCSRKERLDHYDLLADPIILMANRIILDGKM